MKKICLSLLLGLCLLLTACSSAPAPAPSPTAAPAKIDLSSAIVELEKVNPIANARDIDDFALENEIMLDPALVVAYKGHVTNNQADCALALVVEAKPGEAEKVVDALKKYQTSLASNTLYVEYAQKVAQAKAARIVRSGDYVILSIPGVELPDANVIDTAISQITGK